MRSDKFYVVRTDKYYTPDGNAGRTDPNYRAQASLDAAVAIAVAQATAGKGDHGVYEVKLVGIATPPVAKFAKVKRS